MSSTIPEIESVKIISNSELTITWSRSTSVDVGVGGYNVYRGETPELIGSTSGKSAITLNDSSLSFDNTYVYNVSSFDHNGTESSLSDSFTKEFTNDKFVIDKLESYLISNGCQNLTLIIQQDEIPILTAMEENIDDVVLAIDNPVHFDTEFRNNSEDNLISFWYVPMGDLWNYTLGLPYNDRVTRNRKFVGDVKINNKLANVFNRIYQDAGYFFSK